MNLLCEWEHPTPGEQAISGVLKLTGRGQDTFDE